MLSGSFLETKHVNKTPCNCQDVPYWGKALPVIQTSATARVEQSTSTVLCYFQCRSPAVFVSMTDRIKDLMLVDSSPLSCIGLSSSDWQHTCCPAWRTCSHSSGVNEPSLSASKSSLSDVKLRTCREPAVSASRALGSAMMELLSSDGMAKATAVAMLFNGIAAVKRPRTDA